MNIDIINLKKQFGEKVAVDVGQFTIHQGDILGLVGNNGAGKSTLFRLILDLVKADEGRVEMWDDTVRVDVS
ncbi:MAG: ATP-binding cassette domain-containing protein, partial [Bacteroidaceae bacterium]|nr:ATP-binding cassette domain-containing protein [Bacteroidaceae bacterium]